MKIEYPDKSIHTVDCYRFCKAKLNNGEEVYFIEYKDFTGKLNGEFVDSYGIIELVNEKWYKTERKIDYYTLSTNVVEEIAPEILGNYLRFKDNKIELNQNEGYTISQKDSEEKELKLQTQTEPKREEIPPVYRNNNENQNRDFHIVKDNSDEYELQTQTEPKREEIPPKRPVEKNPLVVYVVLPTIDGKEEKIDFNKIQSQPYLLSFMPTNGIVKMQYNYTPYNYTDKFLMYISCGIPAETSNQIITYLDQLSKQNDFSIDKIPNLSIKGFEFQFIHSDNYKYSCCMTSDKIYLPPKMGHKIDKKDMFQRFMSNTAAGTIHNMKDNRFEIMGPRLKDTVKAELFSLLKTNSRIKSLVEDHKMKNISTIPRDSYELDEVTAELMKQNFIIGLQIDMSPEERENFRQKTKDINSLEDLRKFISNSGIKIPQGLSDYQPNNSIEESQSRR